MKTQITEKEKLQIVGLLALSKQHYNKIISCEESICELLGMDYKPTDCGHISDDLWSGLFEPYSLLKRLGVNVKKGNGKQKV